MPLELSRTISRAVKAEERLCPGKGSRAGLGNAYSRSSFLFPRPSGVIPRTGRTSLFMAGKIESCKTKIPSEFFKSPSP